MLRLRVQRVSAKKRERCRRNQPTRFVHNPLRPLQVAFPKSPSAASNDAAPLHNVIYFFSPDATRRFALISTPTESARPFQKSSRTRPSASVLTVAGIALAVRYHPSGSKTALRDRTRL